MKICFFNRSYWPDQAATGQLLTELAEDLVARFGCEVTIVAGPALHAAQAGHRTLWPVQRERHNGVTILRSASTTMRPRRFAARAANYLTYTASAALASLQIGRPDIIVSLTDPPIIGRLALSAARRTGARFVFLCEDVFPEVAQLLDDFHNPLVNRTLDRLNRTLLRNADAVVAIGERMRERLVDEKGADPSRVHVIHNWADCELIRPGDKDNAFARAHGLVDRFVLMHSGNVGMSQNLGVAHRRGGAARGERSDRLRHRRRRRAARRARARREAPRPHERALLSVSAEGAAARVVRDGGRVSGVAQAWHRRLHRAEQAVRHPRRGPALRRRGRSELRGRAAGSASTTAVCWRRQAIPTRWRPRSDVVSTTRLPRA